MRQVALCGLVVFALFLPSGCGVEQRDEQKVSRESPIMTLQATQLYNQYATDAKLASAKYKGKVIIVRGVVGTCGQIAITNTVWVRLNTGCTTTSVECNFSPTHKDEVDALKQGQLVVIKGQVGIKMTDIRLEGCQLQK